MLPVSTMSHQSECRAFTLIELLVVVAIVTLLISILLPALGRAKENGRRATCLSNLHHLGQAFQQYLHEYDDVLPVAAVMPSVDGSDPNAEFYHPPIMTFLAPYARNLELFRCPSDMPGKTYRDAADPNKTNQSFWDTEGTSYEYTALPSMLADVLAGDGESGVVDVGDTVIKMTPEPPGPVKRWLGRTVDLPLLAEYETFHGKRGEAEIRNTLYADLHVEEQRHYPFEGEPNDV